MRNTSKGESMSLPDSATSHESQVTTGTYEITSSAGDVELVDSKGARLRVRAFRGLRLTIKMPSLAIFPSKQE
jgi:hypothetical protein